MVLIGKIEVNKVHCIDCIEGMKLLPENSVDAIITDPPYELGFMGKQWDASGIAYNMDMWKEAYRILKPGGYLLSFGGTRTYHRMACAIEDAGFEIRDMIEWVYGCLSEDTEILTTIGWERFNKTKHLNSSIPILIYDVENNFYKWEKPKGWSEYSLNKDTCYRIKSNTTDQLVSRNHRCLVEREGKLIFIKAEELQEVEYMPILSDDFFILSERQRKLLQSSMLWESKDLVEELFNKWFGQEKPKERSQDGKEPCLERGSDLLQEERQLWEIQNQICEMSKAIYRYGEKGWLCNGTPIDNGSTFEKEFIENRSNTSQRPQSREQSNKELNSIQEQQGTQNTRGYEITKAKITKEEYSGMIFCPTVSTGCFVARRNGKVFITGNSGFPKSLNISKAMSKLTNIGLCSCGVPETFIKDNTLPNDYEDNNKQRDNISNGNNDGFGSCEQIRCQGINNNEVAKQIKDINISSNNIILEESEVCKLSESDNQEEQRFEKVSESVLLQGMCKSVSENERYGNSTIWSGMEKNQTTSEGERQDLSDMQNKTKDGITSSSFNTFQNGGEELNGKSGGYLSDLSQQDREINGERNNESENDIKIRKWNIDNRFICSKCRNLKTDIGGSSLKPAHEPICMARKPLSEKTVAENCLKWGTGGINIDESRVGTEELTYVGTFQRINKKNRVDGYRPHESKAIGNEQEKTVTGRFPANLILSADEDGQVSEEVRECFPETGVSKGGQSGVKKSGLTYSANWEEKENSKGCGFGDSGNASRFFKSIIYQAKASKSERNKGCEGLEEKFMNGLDKMGGEKCGMLTGSGNPRVGVNSNNHPTVKPIALMEYLIKMVSRDDAIILDPFVGSGTTALACQNLKRKYIGFDNNTEYIIIAKARTGEQITESTTEPTLEQELTSWINEL